MRRQWRTTSCSIIFPVIECFLEINDLIKFASLRFICNLLDPYLLGGKKFDMRIYVLVVNYSPLTVYLYRTGFVRLTNEVYENTNIQDLYKVRYENLQRNVGLYYLGWTNAIQISIY